MTSRTPVTDLLSSLTPPWLWGKWGKRWAYAIGSVLDPLVPQMGDALNCRLVLDAPADALPWIGWERNIDRGPDETDASYRARLQDAWETWKYAGTDWGVARVFVALGWSLPSLTATGSWPVGGYSSGHVWIVKQLEWGLAPPGWETWWPSFWVCLDYWAHTTATRPILWSWFGRKGSGAGSLTSDVDNIQTTTTVQRTRHATLTPTAIAQGACAPLGDSRAVHFGGMDGASSPVSTTWIWDRNRENLQLGTPATSPTARYGHAMVEYADREILLFGGHDGSNRLNDSWKYLAGEWSVLSPASSPAARSGHAIAMCGVECVLFGGLDSGGNRLDDTWIYNGHTWHQVSPALSPTARWGHTMVTLGSGVLLFGGSVASGPSDEAWWWDGTNWSLLNTGPGPRYWHGAGALSGTECRIWGGYNGVAMDDVWTYSTTTGLWTNDTALASPWYAGAYCGHQVKDTCPPRGEIGLVRGPGRARGTRLTSAQRDAMIASIRKWKGAHATCPEMILIRSEGGWGCIRGPFVLRGSGRIRGARLVTIAVGE